MIARPVSAAAAAYAASSQIKPEGSGAGFGDLLAKAIGGVADAGMKTDGLAAQAAAGGRPDLVDVVTAVAQSEAALETLVAVRDKIVQAYEDILRMPI